MGLQNKNFLLLLLMSLSILLLLGLEGLWLQQNYKEQEKELHQKVDRLFLESVLGQQDTLINRLILQPIMDQLPDSIRDVDLHPGLARWKERRDRERYAYPVRKDSFSVPRQLNTNDSVQFKIVKSPPQNGPGETERRLIRSLAYTLRDLDHQDFNFVSFGEDSLRLEKISVAFQEKLEQESIGLSFKVFRNRRDTNILLTEGFLTKSVRGDIPFRTSYKALISHIQPYLLRKQLPLFLFSIVLTLLTGTAFTLTYRSLKRQQRLTETKNQFISNVTHELQTPITSVGVALEAISRFDVIKDKEKTKEYLDISKAELARLSILVDKILKMALFEEKGLQLNIEPLDLNILMQQILDTMQLQFDQIGAQVNYRKEGEYFAIQADQIHVTSVIYNLLDNAMKYNESPIEISLTLKENQGSVELVVEDNGIGIPDNYQQKVFEKFFRVPDGNLHKVKGHGLGLSYVAAIVKALGAKMVLKSKEKEGSTFSIEFLKREWA
jgi:signal transduction histidine kinase